MSNKDNKPKPVQPVPAQTPAPSTPVPAPKSEVNFSNPSTIVWPTDRFGLTSQLKRECLSIASRIGGDKDKLDLFHVTLELMLKHIHARYEETKANPDRKLKAKVEHPPEKPQE